MILMLGTPGAGKTTQTRLLAHRLNCKWFSMGELIRNSVTGQDRRDMLAGKIIGDEITLKIVDQAINTFEPAIEECILEGNPRSIAQAKWWIEQSKRGRFEIRGLIHLVADPVVAEARMVKRGRLDDHDDNVIEKRFEEYHASIAPTLEYLEKHGVKVHRVDANPSIEKVEAAIDKALGIK
jgi:adenylate kinase